MMFGLSDDVIEKIQNAFAENAKVDKAIVFGSRAKGNYKEGSDIDIAIKGQDLNFDDTLSLHQKFDELNIPYKIDLINYHTIKEPDLKDHIDRVGIELHSRWKEVKLGDVLEIKYGKDHKEISDGNIPIYGSGGIMRYGDKALYDKKSILIPRKGSLNNIFYKDEPFWTVDTMFWTKINEGKVYPKFLFYQLTTVDYTNLNVGSAVPSLTVPVIEAIEIALPPLKEQTHIANILTSLDNKIDLLQRQNKTLEQLAETLFRQWFVEGADESWEETSLSEIADHSKENIHPSKNPTKLYKHYSLPAFDAGKEPIIEIGKEILSNKYKVISNSILVSKLNPRTSRIWMIYGNVNEDESICSTEFQIVKPKDQKWYGFIYCFLKSYNVTQELAGASSGTSGSHQRVNPQDIFNLTFFKPTDILVEKFSKVMDNYLVKINNNQTQIRTLTNTRDALLPKLMSGEVGGMM